MIEKIQKKRILAADQPAGTQTILNVFSYDCKIATVHSFVHAHELLTERWDLILCGLHFSTIKMFDLVKILAHHSVITGTPFVIFRELDSELNSNFFTSLRLSNDVMGAAHYVDLVGLKSKHGIDEADRIFREIVFEIMDRQKS